MITNDIIGSSRAEDGRIDNQHVRLFAEGVAPLKEMPDTWRKQLHTGGENDSPARELSRFIKTTGERYVSGMTVNIIYRKDRYLRGGDHSPFLEAGFPAVRMTEPNEDVRHQLQEVRKENGVQFGDLPEFDDFACIAQVARINAASLGALALAAGRFRRRRDAFHRPESFKRQLPLRRRGRRSGWKSKPGGLSRALSKMNFIRPITSYRAYSK
jgi:hypothetical protein